MTNVQLYLAIGIPILFNGLMALLMSGHFTADVGSLRQDIREQRSDIKTLTTMLIEMKERG